MEAAARSLEFQWKTIPNFEQDLKNCYQDAIDQWLWKNISAAANHIESWAEGVQSWYNFNKEANFPDDAHNHINTHQELKAYDSALYKIIQN